MSGSEVWLLTISLGLLYLLYRVVLKAPGKTAEPTKLDLFHTEPPPHSWTPEPVAPDPSLTQEIVSGLAEYYRDSAHPEALLNHAKFLEGVELLNRGESSSKDLLVYYHGDNAVAACMALEAYARRSDGEDIRERILATINGIVPWSRYFALRALSARTPTDEPLVSRVLARIDPSWRNPWGTEFLREFIRIRLDGGEVPEFKTDLHRIPEDHAGFIQELVEGLKGELASRLLAEFNAWRSTRNDLEFLNSIGRIWNFSEITEVDPVIENEALLTQVASVQSALVKDRRRSVLLVGESGVGKSTIVRALATRLHERGWMIFEAGHTELVAGKAFIGEVEERFKKLVHHLGGKRKILWYIPDFHAISWAGRHQHSSTSGLDYFLPYIEQGEIAVLGETQPLAYEKLIQSKPRCQTALEVYRIHALSEEMTLEVARKWVLHCTRPDGPELASEKTLREAWDLTQQFLSEKSAPGNLLQFLKLTRERLALNSVADQAITTNELILTLTQLTGLPASVLDDRQSLDLSGLKGFFEKRILGQPEAIDCLVDRVAMIKAGVGDPTRPQGVFLFVGPTGTGKTEIAKALSEYLFGSPLRMIRLDMSEFQEPESLERILGNSSPSSSGSLVDLIRKQPFSVVLLDEFEKASLRIWDLFLQVFDDGRLTNRGGITADFRHAIVIMTSNLGGTARSGTGLGFSPDSSAFSSAAVERVVNSSFRKEFLNRIDRVVVFRPLSRDTMREILRKELHDVFQRRGLRNRAWAVEWDDAASEFLLEKGFTPDLGARPLKRAIERYLLAPLANTIVNHRFPEGDQFLFVRSDGKGLTVEFVDPDAVEDTVAEGSGVEAAIGRGRDLRLEEIILDAQGTTLEIACLYLHHRQLSDVVGGADWQNRKQTSLCLISSPEFWNSADRFTILGRVEYMDRIETGFERAGSLLLRLSGGRTQSRTHFPRDLMKRLGQQLYLLEKACSDIQAQQPSEAFVLIEAGRDSGLSASLNDEFARKLGKMYRGWAEKRLMQIQSLEETGDEGTIPYHLLLAISGFAAFSILQPEEGIHLFEVPEEEGKSFKRCKAQVRVVPQPDHPVGPGLSPLRQQAIRSLDSHELAALTIVRRYRESPSPLVRDSVRGWRTGRLDRVFDGDFDLIVEKEHEP
ncbi:MAG TPA: AAA family ATPase [Terriglobia bacterium]|nr:AAA family ATPase [Terriglobia bacterium]